MCEERKEKLKQYLWLLGINLFISAFTFGGGYVVVPMIRQYFVLKKGYFSEEELMDMTAVAQSTPRSHRCQSVRSGRIPYCRDGGRRHQLCGRGAAAADHSRNNICFLPHIYFQCGPRRGFKGNGSRGCRGNGGYDHRHVRHGSPGTLCFLVSDDTGNFSS